MLNVLRTALGWGRVTAPLSPADDPPPAYRGAPRLDPSRCRCSGDCAAACPAGAITVSPGGDGGTWRLDLGPCIFCGRCAEACPEQAIVMSRDYLLASSRRERLVRLEFPGRAERTPAASLEDHEVARLGRRLRSLLGRSLHVRHLDAGSDNSCDWELAALLGPVYDVQRLGIDVVASPRHADLLLVTGAVTRHLEPALRMAYEAMPEPRLVVAVGDEACGGGLLQGSYAVAGGVDRCLPVDVYVPGSPPRPLALIQGLLQAVGRKLDSR